MEMQEIRAQANYTRRMDTLDALDRKLLAIVQQDADLTSEAISARIGLSPSAVQRRLKHLRQRGVIARTVAVLDPEQAGRPTFFIVSLEIERDRRELIARLKSWLAEEESVQQVYYVTGEADFVLIVAASNIEAYDELMTRLTEQNPNIRRFTTNVVLHAGKRGLQIPIAP